MLLCLVGKRVRIQRKNSDFCESFDDVFTFYEVPTNSKIFPDHTIGKSTKKRVRRYFSQIFIRSKTPLNDRSKLIFTFFTCNNLDWGKLVIKTTKHNLLLKLCSNAATSTPSPQTRGQPFESHRTQKWVILLTATWHHLIGPCDRPDTSLTRTRAVSRPDPDSDPTRSTSWLVNIDFDRWLVKRWPTLTKRWPALTSGSHLLTCRPRGLMGGCHVAAANDWYEVAIAGTGVRLTWQERGSDEAEHRTNHRTTHVQYDETSVCQSEVGMCQKEVRVHKRASVRGHSTQVRRSF